ncbi:phage integrase SAM-like domain-containing protein [Gramella sp. AN32]|uniref:phage integrase SAM-like domain-containing protein n=1 Tax=Gramella sp. AN32 TaxID=2183748 RepID=UPI002434A213|nr:phage integrase SAM-like domain-containing protein [Gramella sp. AN32]
MYCKSTAKPYWTCYNHVEQFITEVYKAEDFRMKDINHQFISRFESVPEKSFRFHIQ